MIGLIGETYETFALDHVDQACRRVEMARQAATDRDVEALEEVMIWLRLVQKCLKERAAARRAADAEATMRAGWEQRIAAETGEGKVQQ